MQNADVIVADGQIQTPVCSRNHDPHKMICTVECEGFIRFLCQKCLMRTFVIQKWVVELMPNNLLKDEGGA